MQRRLTLPSRGCPKGCAFCAPLMSNVRRRDVVKEEEARCWEQLHFLATAQWCVFQRFCSEGMHLHVSSIKSGSYWFLLKHTAAGEVHARHGSCSYRSMPLFTRSAGEHRRRTEANESNNSSFPFGSRRLGKEQNGGGSCNDA